jgi:hypothetical protein
VVALKLDGLAQAVKDLGTLAELSGLLEARWALSQSPAVSASRPLRSSSSAVSSGITR